MQQAYSVLQASCELVSPQLLSPSGKRFACSPSPCAFLQVPGRQCMASALLLSPQPQEALPYLESMAEVCQGDDALSWNLGVARAAAGQWEAAAQALQAVQVSQSVVPREGVEMAGLHGGITVRSCCHLDLPSESLCCCTALCLKRRDWLEDPLYQSWLVRCLVRCGQPEGAWQVHLGAQAQAGAAPAVAALLGLLSSELFQAGAFLWSARAFHALEHVQRQQALMHGGALAAAAAPSDAAAAIWEGKRAACIAAFREVVQGKQEAGSVLPDLIGMLRSSANPQAQLVASAMAAWLREHAAGAGAPS